MTKKAWIVVGIVVVVAVLLQIVTISRYKSLRLSVNRFFYAAQFSQDETSAQTAMDTFWAEASPASPYNTSQASIGGFFKWIFRGGPTSSGPTGGTLIQGSTPRAMQQALPH